MENSYFHLQIWPPLAANFLILLGIGAGVRIALEGTLCEFEQQVLSRRSFIYTSGQQLVGILSEGVFLFSLANMATSGSQFSHPLCMGDCVNGSVVEIKWLSAAQQKSVGRKVRLHCIATIIVGYVSIIKNQ